MRAGCSAWCGIVLAMVSATGCAPFFTETGPASPEGEGGAGIYRGPAQATAAEGMYGAATPGEEIPAPSSVGEPRAPSNAGEPRASVIAVRVPEACPGPVVVTVACANGSMALRDQLYEQDPPPPAPYKPWPEERPRAPRLYHDP
jgi:hypothetical protein